MPPLPKFDKKQVNESGNVPRDAKGVAANPDEHKKFTTPGVNWRAGEKHSAIKKSSHLDPRKFDMWVAFWRENKKTKQKAFSVSTYRQKHGLSYRQAVERSFSDAKQLRAEKAGAGGKKPGRGEKESGKVGVTWINKRSVWSAHLKVKKVPVGEKKRWQKFFFPSQCGGEKGALKLAIKQREAWEEELGHLISKKNLAHAGLRAKPMPNAADMQKEDGDAAESSSSSSSTGSGAKKKFSDTSTSSSIAIVAKKSVASTDTAASSGGASSSASSCVKKKAAASSMSSSSAGVAIRASKNTAASSSIKSTTVKKSGTKDARRSSSGTGNSTSSSSTSGGSSSSSGASNGASSTKKRAAGSGGSQLRNLRGAQGGQLSMASAEAARRSSALSVSSGTLSEPNGLSSRPRAQQMTKSTSVNNSRTSSKSVAQRQAEVRSIVGTRVPTKLLQASAQGQHRAVLKASEAQKGSVPPLNKGSGKGLAKGSVSQKPHSQPAAGSSGSSSSSIGNNPSGSTSTSTITPRMVPGSQPADLFDRKSTPKKFHLPPHI